MGQVYIRVYYLAIDIPITSHINLIKFSRPGSLVEHSVFYPVFARVYIKKYVTRGEGLKMHKKSVSKRLKI
jgi:hypothetical protein